MAIKTAITELVTSIQTRTSNKVTAQTKKDLEKFFREVENSRDLSRAEIKSNVWKDMWANDIKPLDLEYKKEIAHQLLKGPGETKFFGTLIFEKIKSSIELDDIKRIEKLFKEGNIAGWGYTDGVCGTIFRPWAVGTEENAKYICNWKKSDCIWLQRASCVTFVWDAKHGDKNPNFKGFTDMLLETCSTTVKNQERFVQLGTGWLLRNIGVGNEPRLLDFIEKNYDYFIREGLRYAVEKLDGETRKKMMGLKGKKELDDLEEKMEEEIEEVVRKRKKRK